MNYEAKKALVLPLIVAVVASLFFLARHSFDREKPDNCVEAPSRAHDLKYVTVHGNRASGHTVCGYRSRAALPDVVQCYELSKRCTE